jgi:hypothetical protein
MSAPWPVQVIGAAVMLTCADISPLALVAASPHSFAQLLKAKTVRRHPCRSS